MIWLILVVGLGFRLISLNQSLWLDEAIAAQAVQNSSFWQLIIDFPRFDLHPPGHYLVLWLGGQVFGYSEIALRMPSIVFGLVTVWMVYVVGQKLVSTKVGLLAAWLLAINPLHLYYSQEARMYSMATMAVLVNFYFFTKLLKGEGKWGFALSALLVLISDYVAYFSFVGQLVVLVWWYRSRIWPWLFGLLPSGVLFGAWLPVFMTQFANGTSAAAQLPVWQKVVGGFDLKALVLTGVKFMLGRISFENKLVYGGIVGLAGVVHLIAIGRGCLTEKSWVKVFLVMGVVPIVVAWLGSLFLPIFSYFRVLFCLPFVMLAMAIGLAGWRRWGGVLGVLISLIYLMSGAVYLTNSQFQREDWRSVVSFLQQQRGIKVILETNGSFAPYQYYGGDQLPTLAGLKNFPANRLADIQDLEQELKSEQQVYLVEYLVDITDSQRLVQAELARLGWKEVAIKNFNGVGFVREYRR